MLTLKLHCKPWLDLVSSDKVCGGRCDSTHRQVTRHVTHTLTTSPTSTPHFLSRTSFIFHSCFQIRAFGDIFSPAGKLTQPFLHGSTSTNTSSRHNWLARGPFTINNSPRLRVRASRRALVSSASIFNESEYSLINCWIFGVFLMVFVQRSTPAWRGQVIVGIVWPPRSGFSQRELATVLPGLVATVFLHCFQHCICYLSWQKHFSC